MKFKYIGKSPIKSADLVLAGIFKPHDVIYNGTIFEIPSDNEVLIKRVLCTGYYEEYTAPKKVGRPKKEFKKEENKGEK